LHHSALQNIKNRKERETIKVKKKGESKKRKGTIVSDSIMCVV
jgi:hypothetical protein